MLSLVLRPQQVELGGTSFPKPRGLTVVRAPGLDKSHDQGTEQD